MQRSRIDGYNSRPVRKVAFGPRPGPAGTLKLVKSSRRIECMLCAQETSYSYVAICSKRGVPLGYVSAECAPLIDKRMAKARSTQPSKR